MHIRFKAFESPFPEPVEHVFLPLQEGEFIARILQTKLVRVITLPRRDLPTLKPVNGPLRALDASGAQARGNPKSLSMKCAKIGYFCALTCGANKVEKTCDRGNDLPKTTSRLVRDQERPRAHEAGAFRFPMVVADWRDI